MPSKCPRLLAIAGVAACCHGFSLLAQPAPSLGSAASFAVLGGTAVTNSGATTVTGNLGVRPGNSITGFPPGVVRVGSIRNDLAQQAQNDLSIAYNDLAGRSCGPVSSQTLAPGIYCLSSVTGTLTLDAAGDANAVWIFQSATLTIGAGSAVEVINGGYAGNVFWQASDSATLGSGAVFVGNILARNSITLGHGASLSGRALAQSGAVTLDTNNVSLCCEVITIAPAFLPKGRTGTPFGPATFSASGGLASYAFTMTPSVPPGLRFTDGTLSGTPTAADSYPVTVTATDSLGCAVRHDYTIEIACSTIVLSPPELPKTCDVSQIITASGGETPYVLTVDVLPAGLTFTQTTDATALLSGRRTAPGCSTITVTAKDKFSCSVSRAYTACALAIPCFPDGIVGTPYPLTPITPVGGTAPYTCSVTGDIPPGLTVAGCTLSGTPTKTGCYTVIVTVTDANGFQCSTTCKICIAAPPCVVLPETIPDGTVGTPSPPTTITGIVTPPYMCSVSGNVPPGWSFANCAVSGIPTTPGCFTFGVTVTDVNGLQCFKSYTVCFAAPCAITVSPETLPAGIEGTPYPPTAITPNGGTAPYTYSVSGNLPPGLSLAAGTISGTPAAQGCFTFTVETIDARGCHGFRTYTICVGCPDIVISPSTLPNGNTGTPYSQLITAGGGTSPDTFSLVSGSLPPGLSLDPDGSLSGTPSATGPYCFSVHAVDAAGCPGGPVDYMVTISAASCPPGTIITLTPPSLPQAETNAPYAQMIAASGGTPPYTFSVTAGTLPPGLTLSSSGLVSGTPTASGSYNLTITATDANGCVGSTGCTITMIVDIPALSGWEMGVLSILLLVAGLVMIPRGGAA